MELMQLRMPVAVAEPEHLRSLLADSEIRESHRHNDPRVQDAYCLRCMPQVHGAARGALEHVSAVIQVETGSATDNPLIFAEGGEILSGGNFHGAPLVLAFDYAAIALTDVMSISERRIDRLINSDINEGLPPFLSHHPGVSSGFMIAHVAAAALLSEAKVLCHPASVASVPTSGRKEDHVSMGMTAALKLGQIIENAERVLAIELMTATQGLDYRLPFETRRAGRGCPRGVARLRVAPRGRPCSIRVTSRDWPERFETEALTNGLFRFRAEDLVGEPQIAHREMRARLLSRSIPPTPLPRVGRHAQPLLQSGLRQLLGRNGSEGSSRR